MKVKTLSILIVAFALLLFVTLWYKNKNEDDGDTAENGNGDWGPRGVSVRFPKGTRPKNLMIHPGGNFTTEDLPLIIFISSTKGPELERANDVLNTLIRSVNSVTRMHMLRRLPRSQEKVLTDNHRPNATRSICIQFVRGDHSCLGGPFDGKVLARLPDVLAHAWKYTVCIDLDNKQTGQKLQSTLIHEVGHSLGMGHIWDYPDSIMAPYSNGIANFTAYDIDVLWWIFPIEGGDSHMREEYE